MNWPRLPTYRGRVNCVLLTVCAIFAVMVGLAVWALLMLLDLVIG